MNDDNHNVVAVGLSRKRPRRENRAWPNHPADALDPTAPSGPQHGIRDKYIYEKAFDHNVFSESHSMLTL